MVRRKLNYLASIIIVVICIVAVSVEGTRPAVLLSKNYTSLL